ncbi:MAG: hypothetical protein M9916_05270 [Crocinitomicaceae bacterium]|nr:hypothetical protein [Crocinitomicaceae bacterium]
MKIINSNNIIGNVLTEEQFAILRKESVSIEKEGKLTQPILDLIYTNNWLKIMVPSSCKGLEWTLPQIVHLFEALAFADGSIGWNVNLGAGANLFSGYFIDKKAQEIFTASNVWCAGSGASTGVAKKIAGGYMVNGYWKYASGSAHATHFTANCKLIDENETPLLENGTQMMRSFIFPKSAVTVFNTWNVLGLKATASNDFEVNNLVVPDDEVFSLLQPSNFASAPIFKVPFDALAFANMTSMMLGMSFHFLELFEKEILPKTPLYCNNTLNDRKDIKELFEQSVEKMTFFRNSFYTHLENVWKYFASNQQPTEEDLKLLANKAKESASLAREMLAQLIPLCGMNVLFVENEISRVWRDLTVGSQHYLLSPL